MCWSPWKFWITQIQMQSRHPKSTYFDFVGPVLHLKSASENTFGREVLFSLYISIAFVVERFISLTDRTSWKVSLTFLATKWFAPGTALYSAVLHKIGSF